MQNTIYVGVSGQLSLQRRMETIAQNMANVNTTGFRAKGLKFEQLLSPQAKTNNEKVSFVTAGKSFISQDSGAITQTGNKLDIAIQGDSWLAIQTPQGIVYSRDGRMMMNNEGNLISTKGYLYLDDNGGPIQLNPRAGDPIITKDGKIYQNDQVVATIGLYRFPDNSKLSYAEGSSVVSAKEPLAVDDFSKTGIVQGFLENSNVNGVVEMTRLIEVSRAFERMENLLRTQENQESEAIKTLGYKS